MIIKTKPKKEIHYRCKKCGDEIYWNTHKSMTYCKCGALGVDGCEFYVRLIGNEADREEVKKKRDKEYTLSFVEEIIQNSKYKGWAAGRMEVLKPNEGSYSVDEIRFFTPNNDDWIKFVDEHDGKDINKAELDKITKIVKAKFYQVTEAK